MNVDTSVAFRSCVIAAFENAEYVAHWERLNGLRLAMPRATDPIGRMVDAATGLPFIDADVAQRFIADVKESVFDRLDDQTILELSLTPADPVGITPTTQGNQSQ